MKRLLSMIVFLGILVCWLIFSTSLEDSTMQSVTTEQVSDNTLMDSLNVQSQQIDIKE